MTVTLTEGCYGRTRDGRLVGPMKPNPDPRSDFRWEAWVYNVRRTWRTDGTWSLAGFRDDIDIVEVIPAPDAAKPPPADVKTALVDEAKRIVTGARRSAYGTPEQNFERIARFWQAYFENTGRGDVKITAADVSPMMRLMKEARLAESPTHYDSFVDLIGYTLTGAEVNGVAAPLTDKKP